MRKKNGRMLLLATAVALSVAACGNKAATSTSAESSTETESSMAQGEAPSGAPDGKAPDGKGGPGGAPGGSSSDIEYKGAAEITSASSTSDQTYVSATSDESALLISTSDAVNIANPLLTKTGDSDGGDNCNFYGLNAALLVKGGSKTTITGGSITSNANGANGVCIEGLNSIKLENCNLTAKNTERNGNATFLDSIMIYQSMSGDADSGTSSFTMNGGSLTSQSGHVFHVTNTDAVITLNDVKIVNEDSEKILLSVCADGWSGGKNIATLKASKQTLAGAVKVGNDSALNLELSDGSSFEGSVDGKISNAKGESVSTEVGTVSVTLDSASTWTLSADSYVTSFNGDAANVTANGHTLYVNGVALTGTK